MYFGIPQIIVLVIMVLGIGVTLAQHGKPKTGNESFFIKLVDQAILFSLLYWGGFFG